MARMTASVSIPLDLQPAVRAFTDNGGNLSGLVCRLLRAYFQSGSDPAVADIVVSDLSNRFSAVQKEMEKLQAEMRTLQTLKVRATQEEEKLQDALSPIIEQQYDDRKEIRQWVRACGGPDRFKRAMKIRCSVVASKGGVSEKDAKAAIIKKYPELEEYL